MRIASVGTALPQHYYDQETLLAAFRRQWRDRYFNLERLEQLHRNVLVGGRHLALPIEVYGDISSWGEANDHWIRVAQELGESALTEGLERAGLKPCDVDVLIFVTVTGISTPSIEARLMNRLALPRTMKRLPIFGLGCVAGAAGIARAADYLRGHPDDVAVLLSVELCSLTLQRNDLSVPNLIASGLFGDGAAAAVLTGARRKTSGPEVVATRSVFYPDSQDVMGWQISEAGFRVQLSAEVPQMVRRHLRNDVDDFLSDHGLTRSDIGVWISHPGGPKVLEAMEEALELPRQALEPAWRTLREVGNLSSTSVLLVLDEVLRSDPLPAGSWGLITAMGPGFCSEMVLIRWCA